MQLAFAFLAQALEMTQSGTFSVLGGDLDTVVAESYPVDMSLWAALKLLFPPDQVGSNHVVVIAVKHEDGEGVDDPIVKTAITVTPQKNPRRPEDPCGCAVAAGLRLPLPHVGKYSVNIEVDGTRMRSLPLYAIQQANS